MMNHIEDRAENLRLAVAIGADAIANINYEDSSVAPNAAYCAARIAAHCAGLVLAEDEALQ